MNVAPIQLAGLLFVRLQKNQDSLYIIGRNIPSNRVGGGGQASIVPPDAVVRDPVSQKFWNKACCVAASITGADDSVDSAYVSNMLLSRGPRILGL